MSGGEAQRIRLASQIGSGLVGVMYILDEPSIGLHQRDNQRLLDTLMNLRDLGNTVLVVEHDSEAIMAADYVVDLGPGAGVHGGQVVAQGTPQEILANSASLTGQYLSGKREIPLPSERREFDPQLVFRVVGARGNNLKGVDVDIPVGLITCVTGVSGSGKSTLVNDTIYRIAATHINGSTEEPAPYAKAIGLQHFDYVIDISQAPIGRTPRSNPATYSGLFGPIRDLFAQVPESARARLRARPLQLQREGRPLRDLPRRRRHQGRDALPARRLRAVRHLRRQALQPRDARHSVQGEEHLRGAEADRRGCARVVPQRAGDRAQARDVDGRWARVHRAWAECDDVVAAAKRSA